MGDLSVQGAVDGVQDVAEADWRSAPVDGWEAEMLAADIIWGVFQLDGPLRDGIAQDTHVRDRRVGCGFAQLGDSHRDCLPVDEPHGLECGRGEIEGELGARGLPVQVWMDQELGDTGSEI